MDASETDQISRFEQALSPFEDSGVPDYGFFLEVGLQSLMLSNLQNLTIPGSTLNESCLSCDSRFEDHHIITLAKGVISANIHLQTLSLTNHHISDEGFNTICSEIVNRQHLLHLNLLGNNITGSNIAALRLETAECSLDTLDLSSNPLTVTAGMAIANALRTNHKLYEIGLNNCGFNLNVIIGLATTLRQNVTLEILKLDRPLTDKKTRQEEGVDHLSRLLDGPLSHIRHLSLRYHVVEDFGARLLAASLKTNKYLTYLDLERNKIGPQGCEALASHLIIQPENGSTLRTLLLSYNHVGNEGALAMADVLLCNSSLQHLTLKNNNIQEKGLLLIGEALVENTTLKSLEIFGNGFTHSTGALFTDLTKSQNLDLDIQIYKVDGTYMTAERVEAKER